MVNSCCIPPDLLSNESVTNAYTDPNSKQCTHCHQDISQELAKTIFNTLCKKPTNLPYLKEVQLRAKFWCLSGYCHGTDRDLMICFNIFHIAESPIGIIATVHTDGGEVREYAVSKAEFDEMVGDPSLVQGNNWDQIWAGLTGPVLSNHKY